jgi:hypothetical protein
VNSPKPFCIVVDLLAFKPTFISREKEKLERLMEVLEKCMDFG